MSSTPKLAHCRQRRSRRLVSKIGVCVLLGVLAAKLGQSIAGLHASLNGEPLGRGTYWAITIGWAAMPTLAIFVVIPLFRLAGEWIADAGPDEPRPAVGRRVDRHAEPAVVRARGATGSRARLELDRSDVGASARRGLPARFPRQRRWSRDRGHPRRLRVACDAQRCRRRALEGGADADDRPGPRRGARLRRSRGGPRVEPGLVRFEAAGGCDAVEPVGPLRAARAADGPARPRHPALVEGTDQAVTGQAFTGQRGTEPEDEGDARWRSDREQAVRL